MDNIVQINRILIVRNDSSTNWKKSSYVLEKGELGIAWQDNQAIIKVGNGIDNWKNLPQSDYLITEDQILTYDFGKHKISNGSVNAGGKGELFSNWFFNSLREELEPTIVWPSIVSLDTKVSPDAPKYEVGSIINKIEWEASISSGEYEFGTLENKEDKLPQIDTVFTSSFNGEVLDSKSTLEEMEKSHDLNHTIETEGINTIGTFKLAYSWGDSKNTPATNLGNQAKQNIYADVSELTEDINIEGYREGCFYGGIIGDISEEAIRLLNKTNGKYISNQTHNFVIAAGTEKVVIAYDARYAGPISILNTTVNAEMFANFEESTMEIHGANNFEAIAYKILTYIPAEPYKNSASITITLG